MPLRETLERVRASATPPNEEATKFTILAPVLQDLGWNFYGGTEVAFEYSAGGKSRGGRVDIALMNPKAQSSCVAFVEAKTPRANLNDHVEQVLGYAFHDGVSVCVLTNGEEWWLYLPLEKGPPQDRRFAELRLLDDPIEQLVDDFHAFLGKEVLCNGEAERRAEQVLKARRRASQLNIELPRIWKQMKDEPDSELVELVGKRVYKAIGLRPEPSQVADVLAGAPVRSVPTLPASTPAAAVSTPTKGSEPSHPFTHGSAHSAEASKPRERVNPSGRPTGFILWGQHHQINYWYEVLVGVAAELYERHPHDFGQLKEKTRGSKHPLISRDQSELSAPKRIGTSEYWITSGFSSKDIKRWAERLLEYFGYNPSNLQLVWDSPAAIRKPNDPLAQNNTRAGEAPQRHGRGYPAPRPNSFVLWEQHHQINYWYEVLTGVAAELYDRHPNDFEELKEQTRGIKRPIISRDRSELWAPKRIGTSDYWIETSMGSADSKRWAYRLLEYFNYNSSDLELVFD